MGRQSYGSPMECLGYATLSKQNIRRRTGPRGVDLARSICLPLPNEGLMPLPHQSGGASVGCSWGYLILRTKACVCVLNGVQLTSFKCTP